MQNGDKVIKLLLTLFCLQTMYLCKFDEEKNTGSADKTQKRLILQVFFFKDGDHENM